jgi:ABC-type transporter Mla MlaB component
MIRLNREVVDGSQTLRLEGNLSQDVVDLVRRECAHPAAGAARQRLFIDLGELKSADQAGLRLLRELMARGDVRFINCSPIWLTLISGLPR